MSLPRINSRKLLIYLLFWAASFYVGLEVFSRADEIRAIDVIYTFLFLLPFVFVVSVHAFHLVPNYLAKSMFWAYGLTLVCLLGTVYPIYNFSFLILSEWLFPGYYLVGVYNPIEVMGFAIFFLLISSSFEFARSWFDGLRAKNRVSELENEKIVSELKVLRAQVNPHFLFNSLNTIYSESLKRSDKAPNLILKLSDMLRYVVDKMDHDKVSLEEEISYLKNFIDLHKERLNDPDKVAFVVEGESGKLKLPPLLLIIFVENSFKYADLTNGESFISINLNIQNESLTLRCANSTSNTSTGEEDSTGTGIQNARRRLELTYPGRYDLQINRTTSQYESILKLELD